MRDDIFIGAFYLAAGALLTALAAQYAGPHFWEVIKWGAATMMGACASSLWLSHSSQKTGRSFLGPVICINLGLCFLVGGLVWHFWTTESDTDYLFYWVDTSAESASAFPIHIASRSSGVFENVDPWWAPWGSEKAPDANNNPNSLYNSFGRQMKVVHRFLRGAALYGRSIPAGDYLIQYDTTFKDINYHFDEHLVIEIQAGVLVQKIDVWKMALGGQSALVYSGDSSKGSIP